MAVPEDDYDPTFLSALVDHKREEPELDYKTWMNLADPAHKAKIAKHICALSNYGGGWLVFGIDDDGKHAEPHPQDLTGYRQDTINSIADKYLAPAVHCSVYRATSKINGKQYPVVRVPSHGRTPVCAKANGPALNKTIVGITKGVHYVRVAGPKSVPIDLPELWREVIHRCVVSERQALLASVNRLFDRPESANESAALDSLVTEASARWAEVVLPQGWAVEPKGNRVVFAFRLLDGAGSSPTPLSLKKLQSAIREASQAADSAVRLGWAFFIEDGRVDHRPRVRMMSGGIDGYEGVAVETDGQYISIPSLWRIAANASGYEVRLQPEDSEWIASAVNDQRSRPWVKGAVLSPKLQATRLCQFLSFIRSFATFFADVEQLEVAVDYLGLSGRNVDDTRDLVVLEQKSVEDHRLSKWKMAPETLAGDGLFDATAKLLAPVMRLFDGREITSAFVKNAVVEVNRW